MKKMFFLCCCLGLSASVHAAKFNSLTVPSNHILNSSYVAEDSEMPQKKAADTSLLAGARTFHIDVRDEDGCFGADGFIRASHCKAKSGKWKVSKDKKYGGFYVKSVAKPGYCLSHSGVFECTYSKFERFDWYIMNRRNYTG